MKKLISSLMIISILLSAFAFSAGANSGITVYVNENVLPCDVAPFIHNGRTMVPMRAIFEAFGAIVDWDAETQGITATFLGAYKVNLRVGDNMLYSDGITVEMDVAPMIVGDRTFVPVRAISQVLGLPVEWSEAKQSVYINSSKTYATENMAQLNEAEKALDEEVFLTVGDLQYSKADYNLVFTSMYQNAAQTYSMYFGEEWETLEIEDGKTILDAIKESAAEQIKQMAAIIKLAEEKGITADPNAEADIDAQMKNLIATQGGDAQFKIFLAGMNSSEKAFRKYFGFIGIFESLQALLTQPGQEAYVDITALQKEFSESFWTVQHILVSTETRTDEEATAIVNEIYAKLKKGTAFGELIEEYSEDPGLATRNDFYTFDAGMMVPEFEEESKTLAIGAHSEKAVKTSYGYHIVKKYETDVNSEEFELFKTEKQQQLISELIQKKVESLNAN